MYKHIYRCFVWREDEEVQIALVCLSVMKLAVHSTGTKTVQSTQQWIHAISLCMQCRATSNTQHLPSRLLDNIQVMVIVWRLRGNIIRTALCRIVWHNVHSLQPTYISSSYRSNRLRLSHWDPYTVCRGSCLELYYCNMVEWFWWDSSLISTTNWFPSVLWHCWFGHLACKNRPRNDLLCVEWDVKPYTLTNTQHGASIEMSCLSQFMGCLCVFRTRYKCTYLLTYLLVRGWCEYELHKMFFIPRSLYRNCNS